MNEQKSRGRRGGGLGRSDYGRSGGYGHGGGNSLSINVHIGRRGHYDRYNYGNYGHDSNYYSHHDYGHYYGGLGHSFGGLYYPSHTYGYSNYYSPYHYGSYGYGYGFGLRLGGLNLGYSNYSYGYPGYFCSSSYYPSYSYSSAVNYTLYDYDYSGYPTVYTPVDYPTYIDEYLEPVILDEDDEEDGVLDEVEYNQFDVGFYDPFGLSQDLSGYWIDDYTYAWPS